MTGSQRPFPRHVRLASLLQEEIATWLIQEADSPWNTTATITRVEVTPDLSWANVYVLGHEWTEEEDAAAMLEYLNEEARHLRGDLGRKLRVKKVPRLRFRYDKAYAAGARVESILHRLREEEGLDGDAPETGAADEQDGGRS